jgi:type 1 fimbriae regulatory protein FimB
MANDRKHLPVAEVDKLIAAMRGSRNEARDACFLLLMFSQARENDMSLLIQ